ncbi:DUF4202 family protein [uncultured Cohaesibacter sp.]|uniref:DUF4202 family protein n=1 Tax=uncultured Cohaesibacter sp. TaxID=1002546 RepID=UPI0029C719F3|nr:DUF4202 family protein [uncultured Cohaesibacter sp.]
MATLDEILEIIDQLNAQDPRMIAPQGTAAVPADLLRGFRMSLACQDFAPMADDLVKIAARGQQLESWLFVEREEDPAAQQDPILLADNQRRHSADKLCKILAANGYDEKDCATVRHLLEGRANSRDGRAQLLEDLNGLVFIRFHASELRDKCSEETFVSLLQEILSGMSDEALYHVIDQIDDQLLIEAIQSIRSDMSLEKKSVVYLD